MKIRTNERDYEFSRNPDDGSLWLFGDALDYLYEAEQAVCRHDYRRFFDYDESHGPDSAHEDFRCRVCGWEQRVIYY